MAAMTDSHKSYGKLWLFRVIRVRTVDSGVSPKNHVLDGVEIPHRKGQFWGLSSPSKSIGSQCYGALRSKKSITATAGLKQPCAVLQTGQCHITLFPVKNPPP